MSFSPLSIGAFDLEGPLGRGGMGLVWSGVHRDSGLPVAIKTLRTDIEWTPAKIELIEREVRASASLESPSIVRVFDYGRIPLNAERAGERLVQGSPYFVMELVGGGSLAPHCGKLPWVAARDILVDVLKGLAHAHSRGVVHRDLKPANVMLVEELRDGQPCVKLTDFGIAYLSQQGIASGGQAQSSDELYCSPGFVAPETLIKSSYAIGPWTDLYSVGALAWAILCGRSPFQGRRLVDIAESQVSEDFGEFLPVSDAPPEVESWIRKLMRKNVAERFQSAAEAAEYLRTLGGSETLQHNLHSGWRRSERQSRSLALSRAGLGLYGVRRPPFVGREEERDTLWDDFEACVHQGHRRAIVLRGPPGAGKSRLARWLCEEVEERGLATTAVAFHDRQGGPRTGLGSLVGHLLHVGSVDTDHGIKEQVLARRLNNRLGALGVNEPSIRDALWELAIPSRDTKGPGAGDNRRAQLKSSEERIGLISSLCLSVSRKTPLILWLDDCQWGSEAMALTAALLKDDRSRGNILLILTIRDEAVDDLPGHAEQLKEVEALPWCRKLTLQPLSHPEAGSLVREMLQLEDGLVEALVERSGGTPLYAVQLLGDWVQRNKLVPTDEGFILPERETLDFPKDLLSLWRTRLRNAMASMSPKAELALELAACLGRRVATKEWFLACAQDNFTLPTGLVGRLADVGIVREEEDGIRFTHDLARQAVVQSAIDAGRWSKVCGLCADALGQLGDSGAAVRRGPMLEACGRLEEAERAYLQAAVWQGKRTRPGSGGHWEAHSALLDRLSASDDDPRRVEAEVEAISVRLRGVVEARDIERSRELASIAETKGWSLIQAKSLLNEAAGRRVRGSADTVRPLLETAVALLEDSHPNEEAYARVRLARILRMQGETDEAFRQAGIAHDIADRIGDTELSGRVLLRLGDLQSFSGDLEAAEASLRKAIELCGLSGALQSETRAKINLAGLLIQKGELEESSELLREMRIVTSQLGNDANLSDVCIFQGEVERKRGNLALAEDAYRESVLLGTKMKSTWKAAAQANIALIRLDLGLYGEAREIMEEARDAFNSTGRPSVAQIIQTFLMATYAAMDDWDEWDRHWPVVVDFDPLDTYVDKDSAKLLVQAAELAILAGKKRRGRVAGRLAAAHYRKLGQEREAALLEARYAEPSL